MEPIVAKVAVPIVGIKTWWDKIEAILITMGSVTLSTLTMAVAIYMQTTTFSFVSLHAIIMTVAVMFLVSQGVICFNPNAFPYVLLSQDHKCLWHWIFMVVGFIFGMSGFMLGFTSKFYANLPHYETSHDHLGIATTVLFLISFILGVVAFSINDEGILKTCHVATSIVCLVFAAYTMSAGFDMDWAIYTAGFWPTRIAKACFISSFTLLLIRPTVKVILSITKLKIPTQPSNQIRAESTSL